jgi:hypothetical protein
MSEVKVISRKSLENEALERISRGNMSGVRPVDFITPALGGNFAGMSQDARFKAIDNLNGKMIKSNLSHNIRMTGKYGGGSYVPMKWSDGKTESVSERISSGAFMSSNTLSVDWQNLWDALRIDVTVRKAAMPTIRQLIYNITTNPNFTRTLKPTELGRVGIYFEENNGHGQAVPQGEVTGGSYDTFDILIRAAGFTWDLLGELFRMGITTEAIADALMIGENGKKDDSAISPILDFSYAGDQQTAASTVGTLRQELLYNTLIDGRDDMRQRTHPATGRKLDTSNLIILASAFDAENIQAVVRGLPSVQDKTLNAISQIKQIIAYEGETITLRDQTITYDGVSEGTAYMLIPASALPANGYMEIAVKRDLVVETDEVPNVSTLARMQRAWWYAEGIWYNGIQYFVQELTLPTW